MQSIMVPSFKSGDVSGGVLAGVRTMIARIETSIVEGRAATETPFAAETEEFTSDGTKITYESAPEPERWLG